MVMSTILRAILNAQDDLTLTRALKWILLAPQAFLRQANRGAEAGRSHMAGRFNSCDGGRLGLCAALPHGGQGEGGEEEEEEERGQEEGEERDREVREPVEGCPVPPLKG